MKFPVRFKDDLYNLAVGFFMGAANVIPGVSGGTMLFIMGAFGKLVDALRLLASPETIKLLLKFDFKALYHRIPWRFLCGIGIGLLISFATLAKLMVWLLANHEKLTFAFFFGLIAASIISVNRQIKKWSPGAVVSLLAGAAAAFAVISLVPVDSGTAWYTFVLCGAICIIAMILPGLSGSFLLLVLGQYDRVWNAVGNAAHFNINSNEIFMLLLLVIGCVIGLASFVHLLNYLMKNFYNATIAMLIGFMLGSMPRIWPFQHADLSSVTLQKGKLVTTRVIYELPGWNLDLLYVVLCAAAGLLLFLVIEFIAAKKPANIEKEEN